MGNDATRGGMIRRALHRLAATDGELEAEDLQERASEVGATAISDCADRASVTVAGTVRALVHRPVGGAPALEAELYDGSGTLTLVFLGRRRVPGIDAGRMLLASGRVGTSEGRRVIFNPVYELRHPRRA